MRSTIRLVVINLVVFAILLAIAILLFNAIKADRSAPKAALPNYAGQPWAKEHFSELRELHTRFSSFVEWRRELFSGETINIVGKYHERKTILPTDAKPPEVFFFGGSTMWGTGVRDNDTIPSLYAARTGQIARNFGETAYSAHQGLEMLMWLLQDGERPDVVVFYDGVNDVAHKCRTISGSFSAAQEQKIRWRLSPWHRKISGSFLEWFNETFRGIPAPRGSDCDTDPAKAAAIAKGLVRDWDTAKTIAEAEGITFHAVLQPVAFFSKSNLDHLDLREDRRRQFAAVYPIVKELIADRPYISDFTEVLDDNEIVYIDFCHLSPNGNERIAAAMDAMINSSSAPAPPP